MTEERLLQYLEQMEARITRAVEEKNEKLVAEMEKKMAALLVKSQQMAVEGYKKVIELILDDLKAIWKEANGAKKEAASVKEILSQMGENIDKTLLLSKGAEELGDVEKVLEAQKMLEEQKELLQKIYDEVMDNKEGIKLAAHNAGVAVDVAKSWGEHNVQQMRKKIEEQTKLLESYLVPMERNLSQARAAAIGSEERLKEIRSRQMMDW